MIAKHRLVTLLVIILISQIMPFPLFADPRYDALSLESAGDYAGAQRLYIQWLEMNPGHVQFAEVLLHTVSVSTYTDDAINLLRFHLKQAPNIDKAKLYSRLAWLEASIGNLLSATGYYKQAANHSADTKADEYRLEALSLYLAMGENDIVVRGAQEIANKGKTQATQERAAAMASFSLAFIAPAKSVEEAYTQIKSFIQKTGEPVTPWLWLALREIALMSNKPLSVRQAEENILKYFPESAIAHLVRRDIREWVSPQKFFFPTSTPTSIGKTLQLAAFSHKERAEKYLLTLRERGIEAWIENKGGIWRVIRSQP